MAILVFGIRVPGPCQRRFGGNREISYLAEYPIESTNSSSRARSLSCSNLGFLFLLVGSRSAILSVEKCLVVIGTEDQRRF